ncbi:leucine--tRNA ligase [Frankia sp. CNm7]|uniref:Leucine--tRNA ligase n=1 Tax=Frankia nepalensis TaxID=1836974 RepID=A0A937REB6_9ACTN|nr:class I tRNA ligase family protein [Frankia nepalensis]MBL7498595.1 leucine--tRNA ligase [Frankia nepalensis]MBL7510464.1 leucine--tRNA ligase [Frankia nepalensis]MBL7517196.1 leucine--tRNA ligase [Frankia nepalensis]MBL7630528.1 leucine--tRNA ligase [Frankia nepalensis]
MTDKAEATTPPVTDAEPPFRYGARLAGEIEQRWQTWWREHGTYASPNPTGPLSDGFDDITGRAPFFVLDMFPYPSGAGLHVGHPLGYIGTDVYARYLRMTGRHVLHSFGYDAFGLPAEQYAINTGQHPRVTTEANIANMRRQLARLGLGHDTRREIATTDVPYYRWTQWIFKKIFDSWYDEDLDRARPIAELTAEFDAGTRVPSRQANPSGRPWAELDAAARRKVVDGYRLAYLAEGLVNWCPGLGTVLANEEVTAEGRSDIGNYPVFRRPLRQWTLRITAYAERLMADLDLVDWPDSIKQMQRNWIGPSEGAHVTFATVVGSAEGPGAPAGPAVEVYTTRPDTLPGATFMVLAPEHPLVDALTAAAWPGDTPDGWKFGEARPAGVDWTPAAAVAAYRDFAGQRSDRQRGEEFDRTGVFTGAYARNPISGAAIPIFLADYVLLGYGTGAVMAVPAHDQRDFEFARTFGLPTPPVLAPDDAFLAEHGLSSNDPVDAWPVAFSGEGEYLPAPPGAPVLTGLSKADAVKTTVSWLEAAGGGRAARSYRLRDWLFSRQRYWGEPFPIVYDETGLPIAVPDEVLPVELPEMTDFRPTPMAEDDTSDPVPPLARAAGWTTVTLDLGDGPREYRRETNTMPQWAGSCWYYLRYLDPTNAERFVDPEIERYWMQAADGPAGDGGVDLYVGGVEHAVLHLLYARFWHKVLYDLGLVSTKEPFKRLFNQGMIQADAFLDSRGMYVPAAEVTIDPDGAPRHEGEPVTRRSGKMGKSLKNSVTPDEMYDMYGADTLRVYEMAMGPLDADRPWRTDDIVGSHRFLQRLWRNLVDEATGEPRFVDADLDDEANRALHRAILAVRADYAGLRFNTAVARLIELTNFVSKHYGDARRPPRALAEAMALMIAPLAPHVAEELWSRLGHEGSLVREPFPVGDESLAAESTVTLPVQVNGKVRFTLSVPAAAGEDDIRSALTAHEDYAKYTDGKTVKRLIIVPGRIVNIAVA